MTKYKRGVVVDDRVVVGEASVQILEREGSDLLYVSADADEFMGIIR